MDSETISPNIHSALREVSKALSILKGQREGVERRLSEIDKTISDLRSQPVSLDDFGIFIRARIEAEGAGYPGRAFGAALMNGSAMNKTPFNARGWESYERPDGTTINQLPDPPNIFGEAISVKMLCAVAPDRVYQVIMDRLKEQLGNRWGSKDAVPVAHRREMVSQLLTERSELEKEHSALDAEIQKISGIVA